MFRNAFKLKRTSFCSSVFLEPGLAKWRRRLNARVAGRRKQTKESAAEQLCNILIGLNKSEYSSVSDATVESGHTSLLSLSSSYIFTELFSSLDSIFLTD